MTWKANMQNCETYLLVYHARGYERCRLYARDDMDSARRRPHNREDFLRYARGWGRLAREHYEAGMALAAPLTARKETL